MGVISFIIGLIICKNPTTPWPSSNKGGYIYKTMIIDGKVKYECLIYIKCTPEVLKKALPASYDAGNPNMNYLVIQFYNDKDFIGQSTYLQIVYTIYKWSMVDVINNEYESLKESHPDLAKENYDSCKKFIESQLEDF